MKLSSLVFAVLLLFSNFAMGEDMSQIDRIKTVFNELRADNLHILDQFYAPDTKFIDPLGVHNGRDSVKKYYGNLYKNVTEISFEFTDTISEGSKHLLVWRMRLKASGLNSGDEVILEGNSVIILGDNNLVTYHRDYFDMGEFIYEYVPVLGWIIKQVKSKLKN